jgi:hypothetical protein
MNLPAGKQLTNKYKQQKPLKKFVQPDSFIYFAKVIKTSDSLFILNYL